MNIVSFFDFFNLPEKLSIDLHELESKYIAKQGEFLMNGDDDDLDQEKINKCYEVLKDPLKRVEHFFSLKDFVPNDDAGKELLMFFFEFNEKIENLSSDEEKQKMHLRILAEIDDILLKMQDFFDGDFSEEDVSELYVRLKYLNRILENHFN